MFEQTKSTGTRCKESIHFHFYSYDGMVSSVLQSSTSMLAHSHFSVQLCLQQRTHTQQLIHLSSAHFSVVSLVARTKKKLSFFRCSRFSLMLGHQREGNFIMLAMMKCGRSRMCSLSYAPETFSRNSNFCAENKVSMAEEEAGSSFEHLVRREWRRDGEKCGFVISFRRGERREI